MAAVFRLGTRVDSLFGLSGHPPIKRLRASSQRLRALAKPEHIKSAKGMPPTCHRDEPATCTTWNLEPDASPFWPHPPTPTTATSCPAASSLEARDPVLGDAGSAGAAPSGAAPSAVAPLSILCCRSA